MMCQIYAKTFGNLVWLGPCNPTIAESINAMEAILQEIAVELLGSPAWPRHLDRLGRALRARRDHLVAELARCRPDLLPRTTPAGGLHLWLHLPPSVDDLDLADRARARHLLVGAGRPYYVSEPPGPRLRLSFAAADRGQLTAGVELLAEVLREDAGG